MQFFPRHSLLLNLLILIAAAARPSSAQDLFAGTRTSASVALADSDLAAPHGALGAMSVNPGSLASAETRTLDLGVLAVFGHGKFTNAANTDGRLSPYLGLAPSVAFASRLGDSRFHGAISAAPDTSLAATWHYNDSPGTAGADYGYQSNKSALLNERIAVGLAYPVTRKLSLGATAGLVYNSTTLNAPTIFQHQAVLAGLKTLLDLHTTAVGFNYSAGVSYSPTPRLHLGLSYKTKTPLHGHGTADGDLTALLKALGLTGSFRPDFHYAAQLNNTLPQSGGVGVAWEAGRHARLFFEADLVDWHSAFDHLSIAVTNGNNADLNALVGASAFNDVVPLNWSNQATYHFGLESPVTPALTVRAGFAHGNSAVPSSTLTPLTAAITQQTVALGAGYQHRRYHVDIGYQLGLPASENVDVSAIRAGEYDNSRTELSTQTVSSTVSARF